MTSNAWERKAYCGECVSTTGQVYMLMQKSVFAIGSVEQVCLQNQYFCYLLPTGQYADCFFVRWIADW